jgi:hypothetical protein
MSWGCFSTFGEHRIVDCPSNYHCNKVKVTLWLTASQSVSLGLEPHLGLTTRYLLLWQLRSCFSGEPSLTRGWVCLLCMLLAIASALFLESESLGLVTIFYCLRFETSLFIASDSQGHSGGIWTCLHTGAIVNISAYLIFIAESKLM